MDASPAPVLSEPWLAHAFDHLAPEVAPVLHDTLERLRAHGRVVWSEAYGGFWLVTGYEEVLQVVQDWQSFTSERGITVPSHPVAVPAIPEMLDPPQHRIFKRLINERFTPAGVLAHEQQTRGIVTRLIDEFVESGRSEFMDDFARPLPGLVFFELFLHAPSDELAEVNRLATIASTPTTAEAREARGQMLRWIGEFVERRRTEPRQRDVVDAVLHADIDGRPISDEEMIGVVQLLLFGGLDTTAGALGQIMLRFCESPDIPELLRREPELVPQAVEELLRLDAPFVFIARTATRDVEVGGQLIREGQKVLVSWVAANRDDAEFVDPGRFVLDRERNRHITFGAGPHRCAGSNLARMNVRISVAELVRRLRGIRLADEDLVRFHPGFSRAPSAVPIAFEPAPRESTDRPD